MKCNYCGQHVDPAALEALKLAKSTRIKLGLEARRARGHQLGRPKLINKQAVVMMRRNGKSIREIAKTLCVSPAGVHKVLNDGK